MKYTLVSQGIAIYETENLQEAVDIARKGNEEWYKYVEKCVEEWEPYADNEMFVYDENGNEINLT